MYVWCILDRTGDGDSDDEGNWWLTAAVGGDGDWDGAGAGDGDQDGDHDGDHDGDDEEVNSKGCAETRPRDAEQLRLLDTNSIKSFSKTLARGKLLIEPLLESDGLFASQQKTVNKGTWAPPYLIIIALYWDKLIRLKHTELLLHLRFAICRIWYYGYCVPVLDLCWKWH